jgi:septal ring factor EnvC (AmiA/AmiB activator)
VYYGFDKINVAEGSDVAAGDVIGTVTPGKSMYLRVFENGAPQDPSAYVDLSLNG